MRELLDWREGKQSPRHMCHTGGTWDIPVSSAIRQSGFAYRQLDDEFNKKALQGNQAPLVVTSPQKSGVESLNIPLHHKARLVVMNIT